MARHERLLDSTTAALTRPFPTLRDAIVYRPIEQRAFVARLLEKFGDVPLALIDQQWAEEAAQLLYPAASTATRNRQFWTPLISLLNGAAQHGLARMQLKRPRPSAAPCLHWLLPSEARTLVDNSAPHLAPLLLFLLATGARPSEAIYLEWSAVGLDDGVVHLPSIDGQAISLPECVTGELSRFSQRSGQVFRTPEGQPYSVKVNGGGQVKTALHTASRRAGLRRVTLTMLRHSWAVWWLARHGRDLDRLLVAGRWADRRLVARYKHVTDAQLEEARRQLDNYFPGWLS